MSLRGATSLTVCTCTASRGKAWPSTSPARCNTTTTDSNHHHRRRDDQKSTHRWRACGLAGPTLMASSTGSSALEKQ